MTADRILLAIGLVLAIPSAIVLFIPLGITYSTAALALMAGGFGAGGLLLLVALILYLVRTV